MHCVQVGEKNMRRSIKTMTCLFGGLAMLAVAVSAEAVALTPAKDIEPADKNNPLPEITSGYYFSNAETKALQDDDFDNPAFWWVERGAELWQQAEGKAGKSCASCHDDAEKSMKGVAARYPAYNEKAGKVVNMEQRINMCRTQQMQAKALKWEKDPLLALTAYVKSQSRGMPMNVKIDGKAAPFFAKGKEAYYQRRGQMDMACSHCHEDNYGKYIRADFLSQGHVNGFPTYRLKWQKLGSLHRRFRGCNKNIRAKPNKPGDDEYVNLELYISWRGAGLPIESPSVRR
jgi:sulfur-oxidizing protein SoxA